VWVDVNRRMESGRGDVGVWHETYIVNAGDYGTVYSGMSAHGSLRSETRARYRKARGRSRMTR